MHVCSSSAQLPVWLWSAGASVGYSHPAPEHKLRGSSLAAGTGRGGNSCLKKPRNHWVPAESVPAWPRGGKAPCLFAIRQES